MKLHLALPILAMLVVGCQGEEDPASAGVQGASQASQNVAEPSTTTPRGITMVVQKNLPITVGCPSPDKVFDAFKDPSVSGSELSDLPPDFKYPYRARIWDADGRMGFGEITYNGTLVAALYHEDNVPKERVDEVVRDHIAEMADILRVPVQGKRVAYWFWDKDGQRLMICRFQTKTRGIELTVAMGDDVVLDALGISPTLAERDRNNVDAATSIAASTSPPVLPAKR